MKYIFSPGKIKETFYHANVEFGVLFYDSVCSVQAKLATNEINYFCERQSPLDTTQRSYRSQKLDRFCGNSSPAGIYHQLF